MRDYDQQRFNRLELLSGAWPTRDAVAVDVTAVESFGLPAQGTLTLKINDREREITSGGVVRDLAITSPSLRRQSIDLHQPAIWPKNFSAEIAILPLRAQIPTFSNAGSGSRRSIG